MFDFWEGLNRARADLMTDSPTDLMGDEELARLAEQLGMSVAELKAQAAEPSVETTCPLCGKSATHLISCKGCGGGAWGEFEPDELEWLREHFGPYLKVAGDWVTSERIAAAIEHTYILGGCLVCPTCWHHTLPTNAYRICPFYMGAHTIEGVDAECKFMPKIVVSVMRTEGMEGCVDWVQNLWAHWTEAWNTWPEGKATRERVREWRAALIAAALYTRLPGEKGK